MEEEVGGTKIQRKPPQQQQQQMPNPQQMQSQEMAYQQQMAQQQMMQQQMAQQQMGGGHPQMRQQVPGQPQMIPPQVANPPKVGPEPTGPDAVKSNFAKIKSKFGADSSKSENNLKYSLIVALIFVLLNSKFIWKQIMKLPFMGTVEPSIVALIINSILAGVIFYIISTFLLGN